MAYQARKYGNKQAPAATASKQGGDAPSIAKQVYFLSVKRGDNDFIKVGNIQKFHDSGRLTLSLNAEAVEELLPSKTDSGWINGIYVNETKF